MKPKQITWDGHIFTIGDEQGSHAHAYLNNVEQVGANADAFSKIIEEANYALARLPFAEAAKKAIEDDKTVTGSLYGQHTGHLYLQAALALYPTNVVASALPISSGTVIELVAAKERAEAEVARLRGQNKILRHFYDTTVGLWATDSPDKIGRNLLFEIKPDPALAEQAEKEEGDDNWF